ncbi:MAG: YkgJ family cysteine cluster protein [Planctomycetaceae bacterium]|nr:YkgJ family cysteine cluster protein [Planctomycetaceae bacterium]
MSDDAPWYTDGLAFQCTQCGNCCTGGPGTVSVSPEEIQAIADFRGETYGDVMIHRTRIVGTERSLNEYANGDCTFFDGRTRRCTIYPVRPVQCRTWPFWESNLESPEQWKRVQEVCPGAGRGDLIPLEEVERRAAELRI